MRRWSVVVGFVLILIGVLAILQVALTALGIAFRIWWVFWPLILIAAGLWLISRFSWRGGNRVAHEHASIPLEGAKEASVTVRHGAGRLLIGGGLAGSNDLLLAGVFGGGLDALHRREGDRLVVDMRVKDRDISHYVFPWTRGWAGLLDWDFTLTKTIPLTLRLETGASESRLSLTDLQVRELSVKTGASSTTVDLPASAGFTRVLVESGAAAVRLRVPDGVSASIQVRSALAGIHVDRSRFPQTGSGYMSPDYDRAGNKVEILVETGVGSVDIF
ncbi:MAG TPA: LiaF domain-containing protein [Spirochaetia bacterium]|nr:LiaF domain-containing protein [Spirochaetia bacterium]